MTIPTDSVDPCFGSERSVRPLSDVSFMKTIGSDAAGMPRGMSRHELRTSYGREPPTSSAPTLRPRRRLLRR